MANDFSAIKSLNELKNLLDSGAITQDEYDVLKRKIIFGNENVGTAASTSSSTSTSPQSPPIPPAAQPVYRSSSVVIPPPGSTVPPVAAVPPAAGVPPTPVGVPPVTPEYNRVVNEPAPAPAPVTPVRETITSTYVENPPLNRPEEVVETKQKDWLLTILITLGVLLLLGLIGYQMLSDDDSEKLTSKSGPETEEVVTEDGQLPEPDPNADATNSTRSDRIDGAAIPDNGPAEEITTTTPEATPTPDAAANPAATPAATPAKPAAPTVSNEDALDRIKDRLESYYDDVKSAPFSAQRHFASSVERYYTLTNTTPSAINDNINSYHFEEFQDSESSIEPGSIKIENNGPNGFEVTYIEHGKAFRKSKGQKQETKSRVRARFDPNFKMTYFRQEQLLENKFIEE